MVEDESAVEKTKRPGDPQHSCGKQILKFSIPCPMKNAQTKWYNWEKKMPAILSQAKFNLLIHIPVLLEMQLPIGQMKTIEKDPLFNPFKKVWEMPFLIV